MNLRIKSQTRNTNIDLGKILKRLNELTHNKLSLGANLGEIKVNIPMSETKAVAHCHYLKLDGNGEVREKALAEMLSNYAIDYAIPRSVKDKAIAHYKETGLLTEFSRMSKKSRGLFKTLGDSGEGGELLLYMLIETFLNYPQLLCKMSFKTNSNVHFHGIDGIHGFYDTVVQKLKLFWGESKLHASVDSAIGTSVKGLAEFLLDRQGAAARGRRDIELLRDEVDLV